MSLPRRLAFIFTLVLSLLAGQRAVVLHDLAHVARGVAMPGDPRDVAPACEQHSLCAQLAAVVPGAELVPALVAAVPPLAPTARAYDASTAPRFAFLSRAPPVSLG